MCRSSQELNSPGTDYSMIAPVFETVLSSLTQVTILRHTLCTTNVFRPALSPLPVMWHDSLYLGSHPRPACTQW